MNLLGGLMSYEGLTDEQINRMNEFFDPYPSLQYDLRNTWAVPGQDLFLFWNRSGYYDAFLKFFRPLKPDLDDSTKLWTSNGEYIEFFEFLDKIKDSELREKILFNLDFFVGAVNGTLDSGGTK